VDTSITCLFTEETENAYCESAGTHVIATV